MAKPELGTKRICAACGLRFYDLHRTPIACPTCAAVFVVPPPAPARPPRRSLRPAPTTMPIPPLAAAGELRDDAIVNDTEIDRPDALVAEDDKGGDEQEEKVGDEDEDAGVPILDDGDEE
jgi:uncharacterized protein (TIGR02300 family)